MLTKTLVLDRNKFKKSLWEFENKLAFNLFRIYFVREIEGSLVISCSEVLFFINKVIFNIWKLTVKIVLKIILPIFQIFFSRYFSKSFWPLYFISIKCVFRLEEADSVVHALPLATVLSKNINNKLQNSRKESFITPQKVYFTNSNNKSITN